MSKQNEEWKQYAKSAGCNPRHVGNRFNVDWLLSKLKLGVVYKPGNEYSIIAVLDGVTDFADEKTAELVLKAKNYLREQHVD